MKILLAVSILVIVASVLFPLCRAGYLFLREEIRHRRSRRRQIEENLRQDDRALSCVRLDDARDTASTSDALRNSTTSMLIDELSSRDDLHDAHDAYESSDNSHADFNSVDSDGGSSD